MNKFKILSIICFMLLGVGCTNNSTIYEMYKTVNKNDLKYDSFDENTLYYETEKSFEGYSELNNHEQVSDKRYVSILMGYSFETELNPTSMSYNEAIECVKKVLPDDIELEREKYDEDTGILFLICNSSKGTFVVGLNSSIESTINGISQYNRENISGIFYMKEI